MKLVDGMKDEKLGSALLYNFTMGYGKVPMNVYNIVLPLLYNDTFRNALTDARDVDMAIQVCVNENENFRKEILNKMEELDGVTSKALGLALLNKDLDFQFDNGVMSGICNDSAILELVEARLLGRYFQGMQLEQIMDMLKIRDTRIVFLDSETLGEDVDVVKLKKYGQLTILGKTLDEDIKDRIKDANIIVTNKCILGKEQLEEAKKLKLICVTATGYNNIDLEYCHHHHITVCNVKGYSTSSVAQHTFALLLNLYNKIHYYHLYMDDGKYSSSSMFTHFNNTFNELDGKVWGIVGMGDIGQKVAKIASAFGCRVQYYSTSGQNNSQPYDCVDFNTLLSTSDIISIHAPLNEKTENLFNLGTFEKMKDSAYLINVGRGKIVNEKDLVNALLQNKIAGAGLDVFEEEPFFNNSPLLKIKDATKLIMTPHIAWATIEARNRVIDEVCLNIEAYISGKKRNVC